MKGGQSDFTYKNGTQLSQKKKFSRKNYSVEECYFFKLKKISKF